MDCRWKLNKRLELGLSAFHATILYRDLVIRRATPPGVEGGRPATCLLLALCEQDTRLLLYLADRFTKDRGKRPKSWSVLRDWYVSTPESLITHLERLVTKVFRYHRRVAPGCAVLPPDSVIPRRKWKAGAMRCRVAEHLAETYGGSSRIWRREVKRRLRKRLVRSWNRARPALRRVPQEELLALGRIALGLLVTPAALDGGGVQLPEADRRSSADQVPTPSRVSAPEVPESAQAGGSNDSERLSGRDVAAMPVDWDERLQTEKMRSLRRLAYGASHEINNPLANIAMRAETLAKSEPDPDRKRKLSVIQQQAMRAHQMISDLMLFANPPAMELTAVRLPDLIAELEVEMRSELELMKTDLRIRSDPALPPLHIDAKQVTDALKAMLRNSLQAIGEAGRIKIVVLREESGDQAIQISDTGQGIADAVLPGIFDPFYSGREAGRGLGFGLSKAWRCLDDHGGSLRCLSPKSGNTVFEMRFPGSLECPAANGTQEEQVSTGSA